MQYKDELFPPKKRFKPPRGNNIPNTEAYRIYRAHFSACNSFRDVNKRGKLEKQKLGLSNDVSKQSNECISRPQRKHFSNQEIQKYIDKKRKAEARSSISLKLYTKYTSDNCKQRSKLLGKDGYLKHKHSSVIGWNRKDLISEGVKDNFQNSFWLEEARKKHSRSLQDMP